jgi:lauroyl/myristoyl acyltransferase
MGLFQILKRLWINFEYAILIPFFSFFPEDIAFFLFKLRGLFQYYTNIEWKGVSINSLFMRQETYKSIKLIKPELNKNELKILTRQRFINESYDEYLSYLYSNKKIWRILDNLEVENLKNLLEIKKTKGVVFVSMHFDAFTLGLAGLGYKGMEMNVVNTKGITDKKIPSSVRNFYAKKYNSMEKIMKGKMPYIEEDKVFFINALHSKQSVGLMGDIPGKKSTIKYSFFGKDFKLPLGAWKFAMETNSMLSSFMCVRLNNHHYKIYTLKPYSPSDNPYESLKPIYNFMLEFVEKNPEKWVASYLLNNYS